MMNFNNSLGLTAPYMNPQQQVSNLVNQYPQYFNPALQQAVSSPQQAQQQITTQPPIMQPQNNTSRILQVSNREEATATPVDLINGTPTFFYNKGKNEVYLKQFDVPTGTATLRTFIEVENETENNTEKSHNIYEEELKTIREGVERLYGMILPLTKENRPQQKKENKNNDK